MNTVWCKNEEKMIQKFGLSRMGIYHLGARKTYDPLKLYAKFDVHVCMYTHFLLVVRRVSNRFCFVLQGV